MTERKVSAPNSDSFCTGRLLSLWERPGVGSQRRIQKTEIQIVHAQALSPTRGEGVAHHDLSALQIGARNSQ